MFITHQRGICLRHRVKLTVNGEAHEVLVEARTTLLEVLRDDLGLTGTKRGCGSGECGACTVILDGRSVNSCLVLAVDARGKSVLTIEGLSEGGKLHPIQEAFLEHGGLQCGYCTPGMILSAKVLLDENPSPSEAEVREAIEGNLCRCTGYVKIVESILAAAEKMG
ncbi:MAG: (2Fe-2S)-binding protein [Chloroflexi bacterium]|nr:(2Fe-2S)-binding protein [Chloroflexota bacterium]